jgi:phosphatidylinositol alpha-1,6-mannosyltransferase
VASPGSVARPSLLVLTSTFPKSTDDSTPPFVLQLCSRLLPHFDVTVLTPAVRNAPETETLQGVGVRRFHYFWPHSLERLADGAMLENLSRSRWLYLQLPSLLLRELIAAFRLARAKRPAVIHAHWFFPQGIVAVLVGRALNIPVVITAHGADVYGLRGRLWDALRRALASRCEAVTVVSRDMAARLSNITSRSGRPPKVMPMGVETQRFRADPGAAWPVDKTVLFVGRLAEKKGLECLIRAFPEVLCSHPDARLVVVGDGPLRSDLERLASRLGLQDRVEFLGGRPFSELPRWYSTSQVFLLPSVVAQSGDREGLPVVLFEAMAAGRPIVATSVGGVSEVVVHGRTGLLVEPGVPTALASAVNELLDSQPAAQRIGALASRLVRRKFDWRQVARRYASVLIEVVGKSQ